MEYLIKSAIAATEIAPSSGPSAELFSAGEKSPIAAVLRGAFSYGEPVSTSPENALRNRSDHPARALVVRPASLVEQISACQGLRKWKCQLKS